MQSSYHIAVLPGDGIGKEVMQSAAEVLAAVAARTGATCLLDFQPAGAQHYLDSGVALPEPTLRTCERADAILFGAMGLPHVRGADGTEIIPQLDLRFHFDLYAGVRPIRVFQGLPTPLAHPLASSIDLVLVRESTEGLFYARGRGDVRTHDGVVSEVYDTMKISRAGTARVCEFAFALAQRRAQQKGRAARVTNVDKANVFASMAFWRAICTVPNASVTATTAGRPSGMAATARATARRNRSENDSPRIKPITNTRATTTPANAARA